MFLALKKTTYIHGTTSHTVLIDAIPPIGLHFQRAWAWMCDCDEFFIIIIINLGGGVDRPLAF